MALLSKVLKNRYILLELDEHPFVMDDCQQLERLYSDLSNDFEKVNVGDAGDKHQLEVCRFRNDPGIPVDLHSRTSELMEIIDAPKLQSFYQQLTEFSRVCIRHCQFNQLNVGDYVGYHTDAGDVGSGKNTLQSRTHEDFKFAVIVSLKSQYQGGDTILYLKNKTLRLQLPPYSMLVTCTDLPHEVETITAGYRKTLVYFLSDNFGTIREGEIK